MNLNLFIEDIDVGLIGEFAKAVAPRPKGVKRRPKRQRSDIHTIVMAKTAYDAAMKHLRWRGREEAGLLIGITGHHWVTHFVPDLMGEGTPAKFTIHAKTLNETLRKHVPLGSEAHGVIHAHPPGCRRLSTGDLVYARKLLSNPNNKTDRLLMPIVVDGEMIPLIIFPEDPETVHEGQLIIA